MEVKGWKCENKILAHSIFNITLNGSTCVCGVPEPKALFTANITVIGKVSNVQYSDTGVQFDLETELNGVTRQIT